MNRKSLHTAIGVILGLVSSGLAIFSQILVAEPTGGTVVEGNATIGVNPSNINHQVITQTTPKAIIEWRDFNIGSNQITEFVQPSASAIALNRVMGGDPSVILGTLKANGQVWIINPAGILFGPSAIVDVAGLLAATANITNQDFMSGHYHFQQQQDLSTSVINQGQISIKDSGLAALVAPGVENSATITANLGTVILASGTEYTLDFYGDSLFNFAVDQAALSKLQSPAGGELNDAVSNSGRLIANGGKILLISSDDVERVVKNTINMEGVIEANTVFVAEQDRVVLGSKQVEKPGQVILRGGEKGIISVSGKIEARGLNGAKGGSVTIIGDEAKIGLFDAEIDVSGEGGGGDVFVGGGFQGKGPLPWAEVVIMDKHTKIRANGLKEGNGGLVVLWSECTRFYGDISAKAGPEGGNGGVIETSGHRIDTKGGKINASAPRGSPGTYWLDPWDVAITDTDFNGAFQNEGGRQVWVPSGTGSTIDGNEIANLLDLGNNVIIKTIGNPDGGEAGNIEVGSVQMATNTASTLTLKTGNAGNIIINGFVSGTGLTLVLNTSGMVMSQAVGGGVVTVGALQLNVGGTFDIGVPNHFPPDNGAAFPSSVNGNTTGSNIVLLNTFAPGTHFFNGNDLFQYLPSAPPSPSLIPPITTISAALDPNNFASTNSQTPEPNSNSSLIETQPPPTQPTAPPSSPPPPPPTSTPEASTPETPTPETPSAATTPASTPTPEAAPPPPPEGSGYGTADVPNGSAVIGGGPEGREPITTAEAAEGQEGFAERAWKDPEAVEQTEEVGVGCPVNIETSKQPISQQCAEQSNGPVSPGTLANADVASDSMIAKTMQQQPIGPEGVNGIDVPMGAEGIGGSSFGQETANTAEGAEGDESLVVKNSWSPEDIDRSPEYLENLGPERATPLSFWRRQLFAKLKLDSDCCGS